MNNINIYGNYFTMAFCYIYPGNSRTKQLHIFYLLFFFFEGGGAFLPLYWKELLLSVNQNSKLPQQHKPRRASQSYATRSRKYPRQENRQNILFASINKKNMFLCEYFTIRKLIHTSIIHIYIYIYIYIYLIDYLSRTLLFTFLRFLLRNTKGGV